MKRYEPRPSLDPEFGLPDASMIVRENGMWVEHRDVEYLLEDIMDIINSENSGLSHQERLNEIEKLIKNS